MFPLLAGLQSRRIQKGFYRRIQKQSDYVFQLLATLQSRRLQKRFDYVYGRSLSQRVACRVVASKRGWIRRIQKQFDYVYTALSFSTRCLESRRIPKRFDYVLPLLARLQSRRIRKGFDYVCGRSLSQRVASTVVASQNGLLSRAHRALYMRRIRIRKSTK